jgi:hypothetical protein
MTVNSPAPDHLRGPAIVSWLFPGRSDSPADQRVTSDQATPGKSIFLNDCRQTGTISVFIGINSSSRQNRCFPQL